MAAAAVQFRKFASGAEPITPVVGDAGIALLVPAAEPLSQGAPPICPDLVRQVSVGFDVRSTRSRSGHLVTCPLDTAARAKYSVSWTGLTAAHRATLAAWIKGTVQGTLLAWDLEPDGPGSGVVHVRFITDPVQQFVQRGAFSFLETQVEELSS